MIVSPSHPLKIGIVGTGYAAQRRAETFQEDQRSQLCLVSGHTPETVKTFCQTYAISSTDSWETLVNDKDIDLVAICTINQDHGAITEAALKAGKHIILEYPLSLNVEQAKYLLSLANQQDKLLHVEHIEILGALHQTIRHYLPELGTVFYGRYVTITPQNPVPRRWTYHHQMFGFPFKAALPRFHRFTDLFGEVKSITCHSRYWDTEDGYYKAALCDAKLQFNQGLSVDVIYGKGEVFYQSDRTLELLGDQGKLIFEGDEGKIITEEGTKIIELGSRRGLFAQDTIMVLEHLFEGKPLYISPKSSLYALQVADAAEQSSRLGKTVFLGDK